MNDKSRCLALADELNESGIRVMVTERIANNVCQFATSDGFIIIYEGSVYSEKAEK